MVPKSVVKLFIQILSFPDILVRDPRLVIIQPLPIPNLTNNDHRDLHPLSQNISFLESASFFAAVFLI